MSTDLKKWGHQWLLVGILLQACICSSAPGDVASDAAPTAAELINRYRKAVTCWDTSVAMRVEVVHSYTSKSTDETDIRRWEYDTQHRRDGDRCEWFGRCRFDGELDGEKYSHTEQFRQVVGDDFVLYYGKRDSRKEPEASMGSDVEEHRFMLQAQGPDGGFLQGRVPSIGSAQTIAEIMSECGHLRLVGRETLNGTLCFVVEGKTTHGTFTVWIAPEKGYNALKYTVRKEAGDILRDDVLIEDRGITECVAVVDAIEIQQIDGVFIPIAGRQTDSVKAGDDSESGNHFTVRRSEIVLHPDFEALNAFELRFPEGTKVTHWDVPDLEFRWTGGTFVPDMDEYVARRLKGKPLPSLDGIIEGLDPESFAGRPVLVCFWDMKQRPSRHGMVALRDRARTLGDQGLAIVAVQAAKVERAELDEWIADNDVPFTVGMIADNHAKTRNTWGVNSLPWLILTDEAHRVIAEGFDLSDLDKALERTGDD